MYFEALENDEKAGVYAGDIVLYLDSLKVSTIETSAENTPARGGWGNARLVSWDFGKEITITLEDALISLESLRFILGGAIKYPTTNDSVWVRHSEEVVCKVNGVVPKPKDHLTGVELTPVASAEHPIRIINLTTGVRTQLTSGTIDGTKVIQFKNDAVGVEDTPSKEGDRIRIFWEVEIKNDTGVETAVEITISPSTFPGSYKVVGDTFMRSAKTGKDEAFQFIINKAKQILAA